MHLTLLLATLAALLSGPLIYAAARERVSLLAFLDGFVLVSIAGLVLLEAVPGAFIDGGAWSAAFLLAGLLGPTLLERLLTRARRSAHLATLALAVLGLVLHSLADGAALSPGGHGHDHGALSLAIAIHSIPVGLAVWWLMRPVFGALLPSLVIAAMCAGTVGGYLYGIEFSEVLGSQAWAWFQALVAGSILHVVFGRPHLEEDSAHHAPEPPYEGLGNLAAFGALLLVGGVHLDHEAQTGFLARFIDLSLETAPALLLAYAIGGLISGELPERWVRWLSRGGAAAQAGKGMALGLPLPICSCGVLPLYQSLVQRGVPIAAATAFLIATPEVGLTALFVSLPLLGVEATLLRVGAAAVLAFAVGYGLSRLLPFTPPPAAAKTGCGACCGHPPAAPTVPTPGQRLRLALRSGFVDLVDGTAAWILAGLALAAFAAPYAEAVLWAQLPDLIEVLVFAAIGIPLYICAAAATPLIAVLIAAGVSPGAALAFLLTGPATNIATFGLLSQLHGRRHALVFAALAGGGAVLIGLVVNAFVPTLRIDAAQAHEHGASLLQRLSLVALALLYAGSLLRRGGRALLSDLVETSR
jgi:uncharacterized membrane protein YraQ (UPF0718 family)